MTKYIFFSKLDYLSIQQKKRQRFQNNGDESTYNLRRHDSVGDSIVIEESEADFTEDSEEEDVSKRLSGHRSWVLRTDEVKERVNDRNKGDYVNSDHSEGNQDDKPDHEEMRDDEDMLDNPKYLSAPKGNIFKKSPLPLLL